MVPVCWSRAIKSRMRQAPTWLTVGGVLARLLMSAVCQCSQSTCSNSSSTVRSSPRLERPRSDERMLGKPQSSLSARSADPCQLAGP